MSHQRVTVGVLGQGDPAGLRRAIPSVAGQTWPGDIRIVVVDDGATSRSAAALAELDGRYANLTVVSWAERRGVGTALTELSRLAGGDYLAWIDSGTIWMPHMLESQFASLLAAEERSVRQSVVSVAPWRDSTSTHGAVRRLPMPDHDVLRAALTGELTASLPSMLGRAAHFREVGFDETLPALHDHDFLVRFLSAGGTVVNARSDAPLASVIVRREPAGDVLAALALLHDRRRDHQRIIPRGDRRRAQGVALRMRAAAHHESAHRMRGVFYRGVASAVELGPVTAVRRVGRRVSPATGVRAARRRLRSLAVRSAPALRRLGVVNLAHRLGVTRAMGGALGGGLPSAGEANRTPSDLVDLQRRARSSGPVDPAGCLRLERECREAGLLHSAELVLRRGISEHPGHPELRMRLLELLALRKKSAEAADLWASRSSDDEQHCHPVTFARMARVLRDMGDNAHALAVAEEGARRWPNDRLTCDELHISRAACVDWQKALRADRTAAARRPQERYAVVETLGFLAGDPEPVTGTVAVGVPATDQVSDSHRGDRDVSLLVNGVPVATTSPARRDSSAEAFSLRCDDMLRYLGDGDVVAVESRGHPAVSGDGEARWAVDTGYESRVGLLHQRLADGHVFTKLGTLKSPHTAASKDAALDLFSDVAAVLDSEFGSLAFPFYGNLLGAIREHDFITHDVGGFDMAYLSSLSLPHAVRQEFVAVCMSLVRRGYFIRLEPWSAYVRRSYRSRVHVDLNYAWFEDDELHASGGSRFGRARGRDRFVAERTSVIGAHEVRVPGSAEDVLMQLYGPSWQVLDQGFDHHDGLCIDDDYLLTADEAATIAAIDPDRVQYAQNL